MRTRPRLPTIGRTGKNSLRGLPSFHQAVELPENDALGIEAYYIRFLDQDRSIDDDAAEIDEAVEAILERHDPNYAATGTTNVQVAIIAYSKGTISTRKYLKNLQDQGIAFPKVAEFIAIAPPNHGIGTRLFSTTSSLAVRQLYNGSRPDGALFDCGDSFGTAEATDYIQLLNGHPIADTLSLDAADSYPGEAPGSRVHGDPPSAGTLYVTLFDALDRDMVGGDVASGDCLGRIVALNLAPNAMNIPVAGITDDGADTIPNPLGIFTDEELAAIAVHQNTVHVFEVICQALYAVVHHRQMPASESCQPVNGIPEIPPPTRAAAMLTLDMSGSMSAPACPGCATRAELLEDAVELFVQLWSAVSVPSDRMGATYFRTNVDQFDLGGETLPPLSDGADDIILHVNGQTPGNSTAMGGGLQRAIEALRGVAADTPIRHVILFTDGMQNVNPMVLPVAGHHEIANQTGRPNSNVAPTGVRLDQLEGIVVDTIGIGAGEAFVGLLRDIAIETGGNSWPTIDPAYDLRRFFVEELVSALRGFSPQLVAYRRGQSREGGGESFTVEDGGRRLVLKLSWQRGQKLDFRVSRDGTDVTALGRFIDGAFYRIFAIDLPAKGPTGVVTSAGRWRMTITGKPGIAYEAAAIVDTERLSYDGAFVARRFKVGDPVELVVRLSVNGRPLDGTVNARAALQGPGVAVGNVIAAHPAIDPDKLRGAEPGMTAGERALLAVAQSPRQWAALKPSRDRLTLAADATGVFRAMFRPQVPGVYLAAVEITGTDSKIGSFTRTLTATTVIGFGKADLKASALSLRDSKLAGGRRYASLYVTPRDARGNRTRTRHVRGIASRTFEGSPCRRRQ